MNKVRPRSGPDWRWRTFPVLAAGVFGALVASFLDRPDTAFAVGVRMTLVLAAAYCVAHMAIMYIVLPRRMRARAADAGVAGEIENEADFEEELVFETGEKS